ncbi:LIM domains containing 1 [Schistosoma haematobium]|uniref:Transmembrane protein 231 n=2 Tax=Schistosoma haematobium TaxID=6185 RepID=A0A922IK93_SCHHA|nr:LIM domains containing 1 [Schistosoma haematobium]KAH9581026.1 LIM domains containing 1 [Schistosoma haematobium]
MTEIFHYPEEKVFKAFVWSKTFVFHVITVVFLFLAPIIILCNLKYIWIDFKYIPVNMGPCFPEISQSFVWLYTADDQNQINSNFWSGMDVTWSTFGNEFISIEDHFLSGSIEYFSYEDPVPWPSKDVGKLDYKATEISIDIFNVTSLKIIGKRLFIPITCGLRQNNNEFSLNVTGLIWSELISQTSMTDLFIQSELTIKQTQSIKLHGMDPIEKKYYMRPVMNMNTVRYNSIISNINNAIYDMIDRNLTLHLGKTQYYMSTSETDAQPSESFHITLVINLPEQELLFETPFIHRLKWAYIFYIGIWIIFYWPIQWLQRWVFEKRRLMICDNLVEFKQPSENVYLSQLKNEW